LDIDNIQQSSLTLVFSVTTPNTLEGGSDHNLPRFDTVQHCKQIPMFWRNMPPCLGLKIKSRFDNDEIRVRGCGQSYRLVARKVTNQTASATKVANNDVSYMQQCTCQCLIAPPFPFRAQHEKHPNIENEILYKKISCYT
jgi:hypothetical protein